MFESARVNRYLPSKKLTVNHENIPSSTPSIISTDLSLVKNGTFSKSSLTDRNNPSAWSGGNNRRPAVAFKIKGVLDQYSCGISFLACSKSPSRVAIP